MELCWERGPLTGKKVLFHWSGGSKPAYTTVTTVLARLADKELLQRRKQGRFYVYSPAITREEFIEKRLNLVLSCLDKHFPRRPSRKSRP